MIWTITTQVFRHKPHSPRHSIIHKWIYTHLCTLHVDLAHLTLVLSQFSRQPPWIISCWRILHSKFKLSQNPPLLWQMSNTQSTFINSSFYLFMHSNFPIFLDLKFTIPNFTSNFWVKPLPSPRPTIKQIAQTHCHMCSPVCSGIAHCILIHC